MKDEHRADYRQLDVALTLTRIRKLQDDRRYRDQHRLFFIEGVRNFVEAIDRGFSIELDGLESRSIAWQFGDDSLNVAVAGSLLLYAVFRSTR